MFAGLVAVGTLLLLPPFTHNARVVVAEVEDPRNEIALDVARSRDPSARIGKKVGEGFTPVLDALFTATSAATVTGLVTQDTATYWTRTGQVLILGLIFIGGLGFMSIVTFLLVVVGQRMTLGQRLLVKDSYQTDQLGGLKRMSINIVLFAAAVQMAGVIAFFVRFSLLPGFSLVEGIWEAAFQSVSAFNGAGFVALPDTISLSAYQSDSAVLVITGVLILAGALSYPVIMDAVRFRRFSLYTLNTKLVLVATAALTAVGALVFLATEYGNPGTLGPLALGDRLVAALFEAVSGRTAGFSTVDYSLTEKQTNFFFTGLMFVGGASASVAGGIKVNTFAVVLVAIISTLTGRADASVFEREVPHAQVQRAMSIGATATVFVFLMALVLTFSESGKGFAFIDLLFDSVSAAGAVGLSTGAVGEMSRLGHVIVIVGMFIGKLGPPTLSLAMLQRGNGDIYRYAQERVTIG